MAVRYGQSTNNDLTYQSGPIQNTTQPGRECPATRVCPCYSGHLLCSEIRKQCPLHPKHLLSKTRNRRCSHFQTILRHVQSPSIIIQQLKGRQPSQYRQTHNRTMVSSSSRFRSAISLSFCSIFLSNSCTNARNHGKAQNGKAVDSFMQDLPLPSENHKRWAH